MAVLPVDESKACQIIARSNGMIRLALPLSFLVLLSD
jgi:hypothetical protein